MFGQTWQEAGTCEVLEETGVVIAPETLRIVAAEITPNRRQNLLFRQSPPVEREGVKVGMIARPSLEPLGLSGCPEPTNKVAIGIENADGWHVYNGQTLLTTRLVDHGGGNKDGRLVVLLVVENRGSRHVISATSSLAEMD